MPNPNPGWARGYGPHSEGYELDCQPLWMCLDTCLYYHLLFVAPVLIVALVLSGLLPSFSSGGFILDIGAPKRSSSVSITTCIIAQGLESSPTHPLLSHQSLTDRAHSTPPPVLGSSPETHHLSYHHKPYAKPPNPRPQISDRVIYKNRVT